MLSSDYEKGQIGKIRGANPQSFFYKKTININNN